MHVENASVLCGKKLRLTPEATCDRGSAPPALFFLECELLEGSLWHSFGFILGAQSVG